MDSLETKAPTVGRDQFAAEDINITLASACHSVLTYRNTESNNSEVFVNAQEPEIVQLLSCMCLEQFIVSMTCHCETVSK